MWKIIAFFVHFCFFKGYQPFCLWSLWRLKIKQMRRLSCPFASFMSYPCHFQVWAGAEAKTENNLTMCIIKQRCSNLIFAAKSTNHITVDKTSLNHDMWYNTLMCCLWSSLATARTSTVTLQAHTQQNPSAGWLYQVIAIDGSFACSEISVDDRPCSAMSKII